MRKKARRRRTAPEPAWQFVAGSSAIHRAPPVLKLGLVVATFFVFLRMDRLEWLGAGMGVLLAVYLSAGLGFGRLWRDLRYVILQAAVVACIVAGVMHGVEGVRRGTAVGMKLVLFFLPVVIWLRTTLVSDLLYGLRRIVPYRYLFLMGTAIRFLPYLTQEFRDILEAQRLRGVPLGPGSLVSPRGLRDTAYCVLVPMVVRVLKVSEEIRLSALSRGLDSTDRRTYLKDA